MEQRHIRRCGLAVAAAFGLTGHALAGDGGLGLDNLAGAGSRGDGLNLDLSALGSAGADGGLPVSTGTKFYFRIAGWYTFLDANLGYGDPVNGAPTNLDLKDTLDYDTDLLTLRGQFGFTFGERFHLDFGINGPFNYDGHTTRTVAFDNYSYTGDSRSELDFVGLDADFSYDVVRDDRFRLALDAGARAVGVHFEVKGQATDKNGNSVGMRKDDVRAGAALPVIGLGARWDFTSKFYLAAKGVGIYAGNYGNAYDVSAEVGWDFTRNIGVFVGYRFTHFEADKITIDDQDFNLEATLHGPYAGVEVRF